MSTRAKWWVGGSIALVGSAAFIVVGYWVVQSWHLNGGLISALFTALAAIAAGVSAFAAFLSAQQSSSTARDAARALSLSSKPVLQLRLDGLDRAADGWKRYQLTIIVELQSITRATVHWKLRDGRKGSIELHEMENFHGKTYSTTITPGPSTAGTDTVTVDYWGANGTIGWRRTITFTSDPASVSPVDTGALLFDPNPRETEIEI